MRNTNDTAAYHSIFWFASDNVGHILVADSSEGSVPSFVKEDETRTEKLSRILTNKNAIEHLHHNSMPIDQLASKGYFCFRCDDFDGTLYHLVAKPDCPMHIRDLDAEAQRLLNMQKVPFVIENTDHFTIDK